MNTINRLGGDTQTHRSLTPYERGQILTHYPTVGAVEMANRLKRTVASVKYHWDQIKRARRELIAA